MMEILSRGEYKTNQPIIYIKCTHCDSMMKTDEYKLSSEFSDKSFYYSILNNYAVITCPVCNQSTKTLINTKRYEINKNKTLLI